MSYNLGSYNREGKVKDIDAEALKSAETGPTGLEGRVRLGDESETDDEMLNNQPAGETASDEAASDSDAAEEAETADADGDGHDDTTGEFVEGNQEAANQEADPVADPVEEEQA